MGAANFQIEAIFAIFLTGDSSFKLTRENTTKKSQLWGMVSFIQFYFNRSKLFINNKVIIP